MGQEAESVCQQRPDHEAGLVEASFRITDCFDVEAFRIHPAARTDHPEVLGLPSEEEQIAQAETLKNRSASCIQTVVPRGIVGGWFYRGDLKSLSRSGHSVHQRGNQNGRRPRLVPHQVEFYPSRLRVR